MKKKKSSATRVDANSAPVTSIDAQAIAERAYRIWLNEGQPDGHALDHWLRAEQELRQGSKPVSARPDVDVPLVGAQ